MTNPQDENGNALAPGDLVCVLQGEIHMYCIISDVKMPGLIAPAGASPKGQPQGMEMAGQILLTPLPLAKFFHDKQPRIADLIKVEKPPHFVNAVKQAKSVMD